MAKVHMQVRPPLRLQGPRRRRLDCTRLENPDARNEFRCSLAEKLGGMGLSLSSSENTMDQKWNSISSALYEAAAQTIGYSKNHQDWFDENSETIHDLLKDMHRAHRATLKSPSSSSTRQQWQRIRQEVQRATRVMQNEWWTKKAHETQSFADKNDMHNFYNAVKKIYGPISPVPGWDPNAGGGKDSQETGEETQSPTVAIVTATTYTCPTGNRICGSRIGLFSHQRTHR
ncbi:hypothetical protein KUCAC02_028358 [Chaenocephalus aceratus]|uniref:Uncharacterized protein n=1 Tax=Chaenocephalus aceratus TaxID=36190 RepID=A0ACB9X1T7_CHAAC|nr:hypothetical protein KUCAC02_028358 [Chaenocephalus aceratus]